MPVPILRPRLLLRPAAFLKLTYLCHAAETEVGGFGLSTEGDLLTIEDILLVKQECTIVTVEFDDTAVADLVDAMVDQGIPPQRCARVWVHTHPGTSARPSSVDERTFARSFGGADYSVMLILARGGAMYARLQLVGSIKTAVEIPVEVDWAALPGWLEDAGSSLGDRVQQWGIDVQHLVTLPVPDPIADPIAEPFPELSEEQTVLRAASGQTRLRRRRYWWEYENREAELQAEIEEAADDRDYSF